MSKSFAVGIATLALAAGATIVPRVWQDRSVLPLQQLVSSDSPSTHFDPEQSAALFVGVRKFTHDEMLPVAYAVDDAVDLAYLFAMDRRVELVRPRRVILALSGEPQKPESKRRLKALIEAGARIRPATGSDILANLREQAKLAGKDGLLIVSLATHGYVRDGVPHILSSSSMRSDEETMISAAKIYEIAGDSDAARSLIFVDACRERMEAGTRSVGANVKTVAPFLPKMNKVQGQVILWAAAGNEPAYDDDMSQNGVFTKAILDALRCNAQTKAIVTVEGLNKSVEARVREWTLKNRGRLVDPATQISFEGDADQMPLARCPPIPPPANPTRVSVAGSTFIVFDENDKELWRQDAGSPIIHHEVADLDADGLNEVMIAVRTGISIFERFGLRSSLPVEDGMVLQGFVTGHRSREVTRHIFALWNGKRGSRVAIFDSEGKQDVFDEEHQFQSVLIDRPTTRHAWSVIVSSAQEVCVLEPKSRRWCRSVPLSDPIAEIDVRDFDADERRDIVLTTKSGKTFALDFEKKRTASPSRLE